MSDAAKAPHRWQASTAAATAPPPKSGRLERWLLRRTPRRSLPLRVRRNRIYIMPTGAGYAFAAVVFALWLGAMNYSNSMGFALSFLLAGIGLVAMHLTHANLVGIRLQACRVRPVHAGDTVQVHLLLAHEGRRPRPALHARWPDAYGRAGNAVDLSATGSTTLALPLAATRRGWMPLPPVSLYSVYPLGLFRAWCWLAPDEHVLIYPALAEHIPAQPTPVPSQGDGEGRGAGRDQFDSLRDYRRGDALHDIHWKRFPRQQAPVVKQFHDTADREVWLDYDRLSGDTEMRLRVLARQVCEAEAAGLSWGLRLPGSLLAPASGARHRHASLKALACYGRSTEAAPSEPPP